MNNRLLAPFSKVEVEKVISQMFPTKALGPDGFPALFYQKYWYIVGQKTVEECLEILNNNKSIRDWNNMNIVLVPKNSNPRKVEDCRPISLCNVNYKIMTKFIPNQLNWVLKNIISKNQSGFIQGRLITYNILVGYECINAIKNQKNIGNDMAAFKIDLSKTDD